MSLRAAHSEASGSVFQRCSRMIRTGTFVGLILVFPCPWYMIAVGGLLPLPVILLYGIAGGIVLVFSLVHVVIYTWIFHRVARWAGGVVRTGRVRKPVAAVLLLSALLALSSCRSTAAVRTWLPAMCSNTTPTRYTETPSSTCVAPGFGYPRRCLTSCCSRRAEARG